MGGEIHLEMRRGRANLVDVIHECLFDEVLSEGLCVAETLEGRVHVACVT